VETVFRLWAPTARDVTLVLYPDGADSPPRAEMPMTAGSLHEGNAGVWELTVPGNQSGVYYRFRLRSHGIIRESPDPYARACGVNGNRSLVIDFRLTDPEGWNLAHAPRLASVCDAVVYEVHVADISSSPRWNGNGSHRRGYLAASEAGTSHRGVPTGFDHIKSMGVTHVQFLPIFDFGSVDERRSQDASYGEQTVGGRFNWGYDPANYCAPEGSYSTDPFDGAVRIRELKTLIGECLKNGLGVIMDVVYNHVPAAQDQALGICLPGYYFRVDSCSGAGDDTASERGMFRSYMVNSLVWWLSEYKLSGFRFDLMGLHDVETMNAVVSALRSVKSDVLIYGEGWDMYRGGKMVGASMKEARKMAHVGFFNDAFRCAVKGPVFKMNEGGFIHDGRGRESLKFGLVGAVYHAQVHNRLVDGTANPNPWTDLTGSSVNYTEIHDNATLYDKLLLVENGRSEDYYERLHKTAISLVLLAQGQPVLHAGMEFMRTKEIPGDLLAIHPDLHDLSWNADRTRAFSHNSYNLCDRINGLDWDRCADKRHIVEYVRRLIAVRKAHPLFCLRTAEEVSSYLTFIEGGSVPPDGDCRDDGARPALLAWKIDGSGSVDPWQGVCVIVNPSEDAALFTLPGYFTGGEWHLITDGEYFRSEVNGGHGAASRDESGVAAGAAVSIAGKALYLYAEF
jgi:pullulanase